MEENEDVDEGTSLVIDMMLAVNPNNRYLTADELIADLNSIAHGNIPKHAFEHKEAMRRLKIEQGMAEEEQEEEQAATEEKAA